VASGPFVFVIRPYILRVEFVAQVTIMQFVRIVLALAVVAACGVAAPANAQQAQAQPAKRPPVIVRDPSIYYPPPVPHERRYVGPSPSLSPPMERLPRVEPLAQPPIR
jgi:hypothetical protein